MTGVTVRHRKTGAPSYQVHVFDKRTGKRIRKTFATRSAAKLWRADAVAALRAGTLTSDRGPTVREAAEQWLEDARNGHRPNRSGDVNKPSAVRGYERNLRLRVLPVLGHVRLSEVRRRDLQQLVDRLVGEGASPSTIDSTITPLRAIYRRAHLAQNPTTGLEKPAVRSKPRRFASGVEAEQLLAVLDGPQRAGDRPLTLFMPRRWLCRIGHRRCRLPLL